MAAHGAAVYDLVALMREQQIRHRCVSVFIFLAFNGAQKVETVLRLNWVSKQTVSSKYRPESTA